MPGRGKLKTDICLTKFSRGNLLLIPFHIPHSPLSLGHLVSQHLFLVVANAHPSLCVLGRKRVFSGWNEKGAYIQWFALSCRSVCLILAFYFALKSSVCTVMSDFHKQVLLQAKSCCVFERGGLLLELGTSFSATGRVSLDWFLCLRHNWLWRPSGCKYFQANMHTVFTLSARSEYWCDVRWLYFSFLRISGFILLRAWHLWQRRAFSISTFLFFS